MSKPITKLELNGFRGATSTFGLEFDPDKDVTMLFGENGSGKSTILDAIDVICNGGVGSLGDISLGHTAGQYLCAVGCPQATMKAVLYSRGAIWTATMRESVVTVTGPPAKPRAKILRRGSILELVTAQPNERYKALLRFINIAGVESSEDTLHLKLRDVEKGICELIAIKERLLRQLENQWEAEHRPGSGHSAKEWATDRINTGITELNTRLERLNQVVDAIKALVGARDAHRERIATAASLQENLSEIERQIQDAPSVNAVTAVRLVESLDKAKAYIEAESGLDRCPTCRRPIGREDLLKSVNEQLQQLSQLKTLNDQRCIIRKQRDLATSKRADAQAAFLAGLRDMQQAVAAGDIAEINALNIQWPDWANAEQDVAGLTAICAALETVRTGLEQRRGDAQRDVNQFNLLKEGYREADEADKHASNLKRIRQGLRRALDIVRAKRITFVQGILDGIAQEANRLFQAIHPGENIGLNQLKMEEERRGSVSQSGLFHGHDGVPPQAVFSDAHLDTLGFCVWLALAKKELPECSVILVDDIFSSVDASHLGRVMDLLSTEGASFLQVIVATHFRLWWDRCQNAQGIQRIQLGEWTVGNGICAENMPLVTERLRELAAARFLDRQAVSSKAGILLENVLDGLALLYRRPLPRNTQNLYTLGDLLGGCGKLFSRNNLTVDRNRNWNVDGALEDWQPMAAGVHFERVNTLKFIRNQVGCHFNPPGAEIPDTEVRTFGQATVDLVDALVCPNCGCLATKPSTDGTFLRCSCSKRAIRMTPVAIS
ncbi:MAG: AAA family ATPase [Chloroflexi bacterium]|nr:AAA family ATPase [Chloroflexota bacterium]